ncbi:protein OBERON 4-like isoform X2 [Durio zibethinus]|uniref:Protein OBERON 4-like isoform X2 n=1 Tax=Durio zibethinus TaxID=66656 RepID=A0A6P6AZ04_DURZI|nr:protein OBERON 4-like isoform X2 [Durio zibethinus]
MKRLRSSDDLDSYGKNASKESNQHQNRSSSHRSSSISGFYYKPSSTSDSNARTKSNLISSSLSRYDRDRSIADEDSGRERERERLVRKRSEHDFESFDRRKLGFDRHRESGSRSSSLHRSESFCGPRREFPKGLRSERGRTRRERGSGSSWRRFGIDEDRWSSKVQLMEVTDVKSPTWSRDSLGAGRVVGESRERDDVRRSYKSKSKSMSPTRSRDSGSEQSKSVGGGGEGKKSEETPVESDSSSEMEEGEFDPEPQAEPEPQPEPEAGIQNDGNEYSHREMENDGGEINSNVEEVYKEMGNERKGEGKEDDELQDCGKSVNGGTSGSGDKMDDVNGDEVGKEEEGVKVGGECEEDGSKDAVLLKSSHLEENCKEDKGIDLEMQVEECEAAEFNKEVAEQNGEHKINMDVAEIGLSQNFKDKGKGIAIELTNVADSAENGVWIERESKDADLDMEGPSSRGFELFSCSPVRRVEKAEQSGFDKHKDEKMALESLDLSLSLPNVLLPIGAQDTDAVPGSPSHGRSVLSLTNTFRTNSDGLTASVSFSGSQSFYHNPSCSLTQNSMDNYEQSVHSRPIFHGVDQFSQEAWQSQNESRHKDVPMFQRILMNGNGSSGQSSALQGIANSQAVQTKNIRTLEGSSKMPIGIERQLSFHKQNDVRSPSRSVGSHEISSNYSFEKKRATRDKHGGSLYRSNSQKEQKQFLIGGADFVETIINRMVSEPIHVMARKFHEMTGQSIACLKESIRKIMLNAEKYGQLRASQEALQNRSDLTLETLLKSHRPQLEILVALKTGLPEYLQVDNSVSSSDLAEIFLNLRCRNLMCRSSIPVDECDCKVCSKKNGFCSGCMCLVCSKFDMASNTCSWVGCDVCLHWCHADCGLRESYIRNGHGAAEMQFHCVACDHPSEMFGFVKEVFQNFAKEWTLQTFSKELEYVKRIFSGSKDVRGKLLHEIANQMLVRLAKKSDLSEVYSQIMSFLTDSDSTKPGNTTVLSGQEQGKGINGIDEPNQNTTWLKSVYSDKAPKLESSSSVLPSFIVDRTNQYDKRLLESELQRSAQKQSFLPELESFIRIKQEETKMYQTRADDARREAEDLKRIAIAKNEKIEEEYVSRMTKLRLVEAEEMRKQKFEEFQALDRAYKEYHGMKTRMEADIKDLLLKMETTRRNLAMDAKRRYVLTILRANGV